MVLAFTFRSLTSTLFPVRTMGTFSQTRIKSPEAQELLVFDSGNMWLVVQLTVPVGDVLVGDTGGDIEHDDTALAIDVISVAETSKFLLSCSIPDIEFDFPQVLRDVSKE